MDRNERRLAKKAAPRVVADGLDPSKLNPAVMSELARQIHTRLGQAQRNGQIDVVVDYLFSKIDLTLRGMADVPVACARGCSYCCNIWVSATAPEVLYLAKRIARSELAVVSSANEVTRHHSHNERPYHPHPCPLLKNNECSVYEHRPLFCRLAASGDANICSRSYTNITDEDIPTPAMYLFGRDAYSTALTVALKAAGLPHVCYELNSALHLAMTTPDAERAWLSGVDIFESALTQEDAIPFEDAPGNQMLFELAFKGKMISQRP